MEYHQRGAVVYRRGKRVPKGQRNSKQDRNPKFEIARKELFFEFRVLDLFQISSFGFRVFRDLRGFCDLDRVDLKAAIEVSAEYNPFAVGGEVDVRLEGVVML